MERLILGFEDRASMFDFADAVLGTGLAICWADSLDAELSDDHPTYVVRIENEKPQAFQVWSSTGSN